MASLHYRIIGALVVQIATYLLVDVPRDVFSYIRAIDLAPAVQVEAERVFAVTQKTEYSVPMVESKHDNGRNIAKAFQSLLRDLNSRCMAFA